MNQEEFKKYIESIGFVKNVRIYYYKEFKIQIYLFDDEYDFYNGSYWIDDIPYNDLELIEKNFKKELRSFKLKQLLG